MFTKLLKNADHAIFFWIMIMTIMTNHDWSLTTVSPSFFKPIIAHRTFNDPRFGSCQRDARALGWAMWQTDRFVPGAGGAKPDFGSHVEGP